MLFNGWTSLLRLIAVGVPAYIALIVLLRISGKRTLSKFNAFDFIVTVAFGSMLAGAFLNTDLTLVDVTAAFAVLVLLQLAITWTSVRWNGFERMVKSEPQLLYHRGTFLKGAMRRERVSESEVDAAIRSQGQGSAECVASVVLETDGTLSIITDTDCGNDAVARVRGFDGVSKSGSARDV